MKANKRKPRSKAKRAAQIDAGASTTRIGLRIRHARLARGLSLRDVATSIGCSESFISKIENDKAQPSLSMLHRLVLRLDLNITALFADSEADESPVKIMRSGTRPFLSVDSEWQGEKVSLERLIPLAKNVLLQANVHHVMVNGHSDGVIQHEGEELGYVLEGELELLIDNVTYRVKAGDTFFFSSVLPHGYRNCGKTTARVIWVNTPPSF